MMICPSRASGRARTPAGGNGLLDEQEAKRTQSEPPINAFGEPETQESVEGDVTPVTERSQCDADSGTGFQPVREDVKESVNHVIKNLDSSPHGLKTRATGGSASLLCTPDHVI